MAKIDWSQSALTDLKKLDPLIARRIVNKITWLVKNFENITPEPLVKELKGLFKFRVGDWRIIYSLEEGNTIMGLLQSEWVDLSHFRSPAAYR